MSTERQFLDLHLLTGATVREILERAKQIKAAGRAANATLLGGRALAMIFEKPSTRTRTSFEVAMIHLGGHAITLTPSETQLGRGETVPDTARVLSNYVDAILVRANRHATLIEFAKYATVPVINGLTDASHPCQLMADVMTVEEHRGPIAGQTVAWCGDGNNVANSWIHAAAQLDFALRLACPTERQPAADALDWARAQGADIAVLDDPANAVLGADCVVTDTWVSMGDPESDDARRQLTPFQVDAALMARAKSDAIFLHCLPAHRGEEVTADVIDGPQSAVWDEAANRLPSQKSILSWCLDRVPQQWVP